MTGIRLKWRIFSQKVMLLQQQYATADIYKLKLGLILYRSKADF